MITTKMVILLPSAADSPPPFIASTDSVLDRFWPIFETYMYVQRLPVSSNLKSRVGLLDPPPLFIVADIVDDIAPFLL